MLASTCNFEEVRFPTSLHLLTADGLRVDPEKVRAVRDMPRPVDVKGVQRFLGMINYLSKFCDHLSDGCEILRQLTHKDSMWEWSDVHEQAFTKLKDAITKAPILKYYNPEETLTLQCDASETGLGAALLQMGVPIAYGSRALTPTERGYAQIEKECLAIVYGMEKFHQYTYGRKVTQAAYYNRHAKDLGALQQGDRVRIQPGEHTKAWTKATVVKPVDHRSYDVQLDSGNILRRNRRHLRKDRVTTAENTKPGTGNSDPTMGANPVKYAPVMAVTKSGRKVVRPHYLKDYIQ
uniref:Reverse transcriptase/retrotransposon-derived protein RNase H-like domain-containing protein n=1 Tax=Denticeps clupeoides TaxID=299321 RepID=A0AAY4BL29_9TELE